MSASCADNIFVKGLQGSIVNGQGAWELGTVNLLYAVVHGQMAMSAMERWSPTRYPEGFLASAVSIVR